MGMRMLFPIFCLWVCAVATAEESITLTLEEAVDIALRDNREILLKQEDLKKAKGKLKEAKAGLLPDFSVTSSWTDTLDYHAKDSASISNQLSLKQYLYKGGETTNAIEQNRYKIEVSQSVLDRTVLETILNVKRAFFTLLLAEEYAKLNENILANTRAHLKAVEERYRYGQASESDLLKVREAGANMEYVLETSLNQVEGAKVNLRNILYLARDAEIKPEGGLVYEPIEVAFDEVYLKALNLRPERRQYEAQEKADKLQIEITKADNRPSIYASWDYYSRSTAAASTAKGWQEHQIIGITLSWPIFDGLATRAKIEQATVDLKETQLLKEKTVADITSELKNAYIDLTDAISRLKARDSEVNLYKDSLRVMQDKHRAGLTSALDLEDARLSLEIAGFNRREAVYDYLVAKARLEKAMGGFE